MSKQGIIIPRKKIAAFCQRWNIKELDLFGSVLRDDFHPESDVDVLVSFKPEAKISLFDMVSMESELERIFQRQVDLVEKEALQNPYRKQEVLRTARVIYAA